MSTNKNSNRIEVPEAKQALDQFKMEVAEELGVPLTNGYNGNLTSYQNGSVGGYMVKKMLSERIMVPSIVKESVERGIPSLKNSVLISSVSK